MEENSLLAKIAAAKDHVRAAEAELEQLMRELPAELRADKTTVSEVMQSAFTKLRAAKSGVVDLEKLLSSADD